MSGSLMLRLLYKNHARNVFCQSRLGSYNKIALTSLSSYCANRFCVSQNSQLQLIPKNISVNCTTVKKATSDAAKHDHVAHWTAERVMTVLLMGSIPAAIVFPTPYLEYFMALTLTVHAHWGIEAIVVDYVRPSIFGSMIPKLSVAAVYGLSALTLGGLFYFIYTDVGLVNAVKLLWKL